MTCLHPPTSIADAQAIVAACGGPDWRDAFLLGLGTLVLLVFAFLMVWLALRSVSGR